MEETERMLFDDRDGMSDWLDIVVAEIQDDKKGENR